MAPIAEALRPRIAPEAVTALGRALEREEWAGKLKRNELVGLHDKILEAVSESSRSIRITPEDMEKLATELRFHVMGHKGEELTREKITELFIERVQKIGSERVWPRG